MNRREAAIISAHTGVLVGRFSDLQKYAEELMGQPLATMGMMLMADKISELSKPDFDKLMEDIEDENISKD